MHLLRAGFCARKLAFPKLTAMSIQTGFLDLLPISTCTHDIFVPQQHSRVAVQELARRVAHQDAAMEKRIERLIRRKITCIYYCVTWIPGIPG